MLQHNWRLVGLALIGVLGVIAGAVFAAGPGEAEVRISAVRHDDGRVEVGLQQRGGDGGWGERSLPRQRFLPPGASGRWLHSSPIALQAARDDGGMTGDSTASGDAPAELYCIVHHGAENDPFWNNFNLVARQNALELGLTNVEIHGEPEISAQAAAIADCVQRGALGIASSIPEIDGLRDALIAARTGGAFLVTFNSGAELAGQVGSTVHYGLDDRAAGELAGREFNAAGATGTVLCLIHEQVNIGLQDRCSGLESAYGGPVERVALPPGSLADPSAASGAIAQAIGAREAAGVLVLNAELIQAAVGAVQFRRSEALVGSIGRSEASLALVYEGRQLFAIDDGDLVQASHVMLALKNVDASPSARAMLALTAQQAPETTTMLIRPVALNRAYLDHLPEGWQQQVCALARQFDPAQTPSFCHP